MTEKEMRDEEIFKLVKNLEPYFFGYTAKENRLKNDSGLEFLFQDIWGKTTVVGLGAKSRHSIGCSFTKPLEKISKDIKRRLLPKYRDDFFENKKEQRELEEKEAFDRKKLAALAQSCGGRIKNQYSSFWRTDKYVSFKDGSIAQTIGFNPVGKLNYRVRSGNGTDPANGPFKDECITTKIAPSDGNCRNAWVLWEEAPQGSANVIGPIDSSSPPVITDSTFETYAARKLSLSTSQIDEWGINQRKKLVNTKDGLSSGGPHNNQSF